MSTSATRRRIALAAGASSLFAAVTVASSAVAPVGAISTPVDIDVRLALGDDARTFSVDGVVPGDGFELDLDDESPPNETGFCGAVGVDIDPDAQTITLVPLDGGCLWDDVTVDVATTELTEVELVQNEIVVDSVGETTFDFGVTDGVLSVAWTSTSSLTLSDDPADTTVFSYAADPSASLSPGTVQAGTDVEVTGDGCPNSPVEVLVQDGQGAEVAVGGETIGAADGTWSFDIDTTGLAAGAYTVAARCILADLAGFDYDALSFTVTTAATPPATPTPANPDLTG